MDEQEIRSAELVAKYLQNTLSVEEVEELEILMTKLPHLKSWVDNQEQSIERVDKRKSDYYSLDLEEDWQDILLKRELYKTPKRKLKKWWGVAASILAISLVGGILFIVKNISKSMVESSVVELVVPGTDQAVLTLSDGSKIGLEAGDSRTVVDGDIRIQSVNDMLDYSSVINSTPQRHSLRVPMGVLIMYSFQMELKSG